jgi:hypothetical protein
VAGLKVKGESLLPSPEVKPAVPGLWDPLFPVEAILLITELSAKTNSMVWVRERTIPTERPPLVGELIANFCG